MDNSKFFISRNFPVLDRSGGVHRGVQHCGQGEGEDGGQRHHPGEQGGHDGEGRLGVGCDPEDPEPPVTDYVSDHSDELD